MRLTSAELVELPPGVLQVWRPVAAGAASTADAPPSFNQINHLLATRERGGWLATSFLLPDAVSDSQLAAAFAGLIERHETLRTTITFDEAGVPSTEVHQGPFECAVTSSRAESLFDVIDGATRPGSFPAYVFIVLTAREDTPSRRVVAAFDHCHVDALSMAVVVRDLVAFFDDSPLPAVGSYLDACRAQPPSADFSGWHEFLDAHGGGLPHFPLVTSREPATSQVVVQQIVSARQAAALDTWGARFAVRMPAIMVAASAHALAQCGWAGDYATLLAISTRDRPEWAEAMGWFVSNGPITVPVAESLSATAVNAQQQIQVAKRLGRQPLGRMLAEYAPGFAHEGDVAMVSYVDYRRSVGVAEQIALDAVQISASSLSSDVQTWWIRNDDGIAVRCRMPSTSADQVVQWLNVVANELDSIV